MRKKIVVLGGGLTGLSAAEKLSRQFGEQVVVIEKENFLGGLAATLSKNNLSFDLGSHRLHHNYLPQAITHIKKIVGNDLLKRKRKGKVYFRGKFLNYPPNVLNLLQSFSSPEIVKFLSSYFKKFLMSKNGKQHNFETAMIKKVGKEVYDSLYRDYAKKLWGRDPQKISADGVLKRRVSFDLKAVGKSFRRNNHHFLYPREGIGHIANKMGENILAHRGKIISGAKVKSISWNGKIESISIIDSKKAEHVIEPSVLISTIPIDDLYEMIFKENSEQIEWRGLRLLYILIDEELDSESETYYFPNLDTIMGRVSEIKKYSPDLNSTVKGTLLTVEIPSSLGDKIGNMSEKDLLHICLKDLVRAKILKNQPKDLNYFSLKKEKVYPVYKLGWKDSFFEVYDKLEAIENLFTVGRGGLFLHCNIDHCITQGTELADFVLTNEWRDKESWGKRVAQFLQFSARD